MIKFGSSGFSERKQFIFKKNQIIQLRVELTKLLISKELKTKYPQSRHKIMRIKISESGRQKELKEKRKEALVKRNSYSKLKIENDIIIQICLTHCHL